MRRFFAVLTPLILLSSGIVMAATPSHPRAQPLGKFGGWEAVHILDQNNKYCYMAIAPTSTVSTKPVKGRDPNVLFFITHWPTDNQKDGVTISTGYSYKPGSKAIVSIDGKSYEMSTGGPGTGAESNMAWMEDDEQEASLAAAIRAGDTLTVKGTSKRGTVITDTYNITGSAEAYSAITKACGL
ncbi:MAG: invasion associated locus B family protein [Alphaproteobacteria bacterium]